MIKLFDGYSIEADPYCYELMKTTDAIDKKTGETKKVKKPVSYHNTVASALQAFYGLLCRKVVQDMDMNIGEAITTFKLFEDKLNDALTTVSDAEVYMREVKTNDIRR